MTQEWQFWIDRGGTFTDVVVRGPDGGLSVQKLLSDNPEAYRDAATEAVRRTVGETAAGGIAVGKVDGVRMGTTVATNALLERKGARTLLLTNAGLEATFLVGQQHRDDLFALKPTRPAPLYDKVVGIAGRLEPDGSEVTPIDPDEVRLVLDAAKADGFEAVAVVLMHAYASPAHEKAVADLARAVGFAQISASHDVSPTLKILPRGDTTLADAYLSPVLRRYVDQVQGALGDTKLDFMQSSGGLVPADRFRGRDAILSGPAGGMVASMRIGQHEGLEKLITLDMGGTSTDVSLFDGQLNRVTDTVVAGSRLTVPMIDIHTVAAGGGSICSFEDGQLRVGPHSAGANPGPACYGRGGPLTVTDCNLVLGRLQAGYFPSVFGPNSDEPLDPAASKAALEALYATLEQAGQSPQSVMDLAEGLIEIAVEHMARAIRKISVARGHDARDFALLPFGGAGGQHATKVADALEMDRVLIPPYAGVLSALGMGLADESVVKDLAAEVPISDRTKIEAAFRTVDAAAHDALGAAPGEALTAVRCLKVRFDGTDTLLTVPDGPAGAVRAAADSAYERLYGFTPEAERGLTAERVEVELTRPGAHPSLSADVADTAVQLGVVDIAAEGQTHQGPVYDRAALKIEETVNGPCLILEDGATTFVDVGWSASRTAQDGLLLKRCTARAQSSMSEAVDPIRLAVFNNLFMALAEEMGGVLSQTAMSVNMKERLDYSCAVFDAAGRLIANAPHMPVHLGSMGASVEAVLEVFGGQIRGGDAFLVNDPIAGGTHLPDLTVITPWFTEGDDAPRFFLASRGHHADIGGTAPGSMPAFSMSLSEEGVRFPPTRIVANGKLDEDGLTERLTEGAYPARNPAQNIADIKAQLAANARGLLRLSGLVNHYSLSVVEAYMGHVQANAEDAVRDLIKRLKPGHAVSQLDNGAQICVALTVDGDSQTATLDFTGTSGAGAHNFNAPLAVTKAASLYAFRLMTGADIPLNHGCLAPINLIVPDGCLLNPPAGSAVVAGNVETSQVITNTILRAAGAMAASQGTMNNVTFGNDRVQYYETLAGGSGAGPGFDGTAAIQCHMTNSRLTDHEVLEHRLPVRVERFQIREGSGGTGAYRGGDGLIRSLRFTEDVSFSLLSNDREQGPVGMDGGIDGSPGTGLLVRAGGSTEILAGAIGLDLKAGDTVTVETPGGGGFGLLSESET